MYSKAVSDFITQELAGRQLSACKLSEQSGVADSTISDMVNGKSKLPEMSNIIKILNFLDCPFERIFKPHYTSLEQHTFEKPTAEEVRKNILKNLNLIYSKYNISKTALAKLCGFKVSKIYTFQYGTSKILSIDALCAIADTLSVSVDALIGRYPLTLQDNLVTRDDK